MQVIDRKVRAPWLEGLPVLLVVAVGAWAKAMGDGDTDSSSRAIVFGVLGLVLLLGTLLVHRQKRPLLTGLWAVMFVEAASGLGTALASGLPGDDAIILERQTNAALGAVAAATYGLAIVGAVWWGRQSLRHAFLLLAAYAVVFAPVLPSLSAGDSEPSFFVVQWVLLVFAVAGAGMVLWVVHSFGNWDPRLQRRAVSALFLLATVRTGLVYSPVIFIAPLRGIDSIFFGLAGFAAIYGVLLTVTWVAVKGRANALS